jgi:hypothetical protein
MRWKIVLEGTDELGSAHRSELTIDKDLERASAGEIGFSVEDGKGRNWGGESRSDFPRFRV